MDSTLYTSASYADRSGRAISASAAVNAGHANYAGTAAAIEYILPSDRSVSGLEIRPHSASISSTQVTGISSSLGQVVDSFDATIGSAARWTVSINDGTNFRGCKVVASWNRHVGMVDYSEVGVNQLGSVPVYLSVVYQLDGTVALKAAPTVGFWSIKVVRMVI